MALTLHSGEMRKTTTANDLREKRKVPPLLLDPPDRGVKEKPAAGKVQRARSVSDG
jgi:hypothetical protein